MERAPADRSACGRSRRRLRPPTAAPVPPTAPRSAPAPSPRARAPRPPRHADARTALRASGARGWVAGCRTAGTRKPLAPRTNEGSGPASQEPGADLRPRGEESFAFGRSPGSWSARAWLSPAPRPPSPSPTIVEWVSRAVSTHSGGTAPAGPRSTESIGLPASLLCPAGHRRLYFVFRYYRSLRPRRLEPVKREAAA